MKHPQGAPGHRRLHTTKFRVKHRLQCSCYQSMPGQNALQQASHICHALQAQDQGSYGTQYEARDFSLPSISRQERQAQQGPIQVRTCTCTGLPRVSLTHGSSACSLKSCCMLAAAEGAPLLRLQQGVYCSRHSPQMDSGALRAWLNRQSSL